MKILSVADIRNADQFTIEHEPIKSIDLMERAAGKCVDWMRSNLELNEQRIIVFAGIGNNGGDGLVIARKLAEEGIRVLVCILRFSDKASADFRTNFDRLKKLDLEIVEVSDGNFDLAITSEDIIVDAVFGSGLNKEVKGWLKSVFEVINEAPCLTISIDIPSGLFADDNRDNSLESVIKADVTLTFQNPKLAFVLESSGGFCGDWSVLDIGLNEEYISGLQGNFHAIDASFVEPILTEREKFAHKGSYGHALIVAGSKGKMGASVLATRACLRSGIGLLTTLSPSCGYEIVQQSVPEAMVIVSKGKDFIRDLPLDMSPFNVVGIGPGLGQDSSALALLKELFNIVRSPMVIDADALNVMSVFPNLLGLVPAGSVLTPHPGEFRRLAGSWKDDLEKLEKQRDFSSKHKVIVVLKGAHTSISEPGGQVYFNTTGNPGMATAGSGDALLGIITGLLGRGYNSLEAAQLGVYLHGLAGDFAAGLLGEESLIAGDIISHLPDAFQLIYEQ
ncbi:MAG TPA: bifunctional ADP-dependent NAD(P)H-hydrate dehydratase/NAD(P)H-hydrate epimerase [Flavobacteriales bacterium]|nr:bifunctional ADP-dependent NAD(P)H-hydrate dehydratase/NAD(P)H-hydrate epimerase [Flavobacteriales bacterium]